MDAIIARRGDTATRRAVIPRHVRDRTRRWMLSAARTMGRDTDLADGQAAALSRSVPLPRANLRRDEVETEPAPCYMKGIARASWAAKFGPSFTSA